MKEGNKPEDGSVVHEAAQFLLVLDQRHTQREILLDKIAELGEELDTEISKCSENAKAHLQKLRSDMISQARLLRATHTKRLSIHEADTQFMLRHYERSSELPFQLNREHKREIHSTFTTLKTITQRTPTSNDTLDIIRLNMPKSIKIKTKVAGESGDVADWVKSGFFGINRNIYEITTATCLVSAGGGTPGPTRQAVPFLHPYGIAAHPRTGHLYVTDKDNHCVRILDKDLKLIHTVGSKGSGPGEFDNPRGITVSAGGEWIAVVEFFNHRVQVFDTQTNKLVRIVSGKGDAVGKLNSPTGVAFDPENFIYVTDEDNHRIQKFSFEGEHIAVFGQSGSPGGCKDGLGIVITDSCEVVVAPRSGDVIKVYSLAGEFLRDITVTRTGHNWNFLSRGPNGGFVLGDYDGNKVIFVDSNGAVVQEFSVPSPCGTTFGPDQSFYVVLTRGSEVRKY